MLSIITVCYNKYNYTKNCINNIFKLRDDSYELIVIDNASSDETQKELSAINKHNFTFIRNEENLFHSKACNQGFRIAKGDTILFLNNDIKVKSNFENWADKIVVACNAIGGLVGANMGQLDNNFNFIKEAKTQLSGNNTYLSGWCIAANKEVWNKLDLSGKGEIWDENFFYFNDTDLGFRCKKQNIPQTVFSLEELDHFGKVSSAQLNINKLYNEGRQLFLKKWRRNLSSG